MLTGREKVVPEKCILSDMIALVSSRLAENTVGVKTKPDWKLSLFTNRSPPLPLREMARERMRGSDKNPAQSEHHNSTLKTIHAVTQFPPLRDMADSAGQSKGNGVTHSTIQFFLNS